MYKMNIVDTLVEIAKEEGVTNCNLGDLKNGAGQGYLGSINIVDINGETECGKEKRLSFVIKTGAMNEQLRQSGLVPVFAREIRMYKAIFPAFYKFEKEKGVENPFSIVPKCYYTRDKVKPEILVLENLNRSGFVNWNRKLQMDDAHVKMVLKGLGRFHAVSFAMQDQDRVLFEHLTENLDNVFDVFVTASDLFHAFTGKSKLALGALEPNTDVFTKYERFLENVEQSYKDLIHYSDKYSTILHGDSWLNNSLFKYKDGSTEPVDVRFVDYQFSRLGSPVYDLAYFMYPCTTEEILNNMEEYKRVYYNSLAEHLRLLGSNPDEAYPIDVFEDHWRKLSVFGLISSGLINFSLLSEDNEIVDFETVAEAGRKIGTAFDYEISNIKEFNNRMRRVIEYFVKNDLL